MGRSAMGFCFGPSHQRASALPAAPLSLLSADSWLPKTGDQQLIFVTVEQLLAN